MNSFKGFNSLGDAIQYLNEAGIELKFSGYVT